jgi:uncharacterized membrane protein
VDSLVQTESKTKMISLTAVSTAIVYVTTSISIKMPPPLGAWHMGDVGSFIVALLFGPTVGAFACGVGAMMYDVWNPFWGSSFIAWAPATLIIRSIMGYMLGRYRDLFDNKLYSDIVIMAISQIWKNVGYIAYDYFTRGAAAWMDLTFFPLSAISIVIAIPLLKGVRKALNTEKMLI